MSHQIAVHRIDLGGSQTWCGRVLMAPVEGHAVGVDRVDGAPLHWSTVAYTCDLCTEARARRNLARGRAAHASRMGEGAAAVLAAIVVALLVLLIPAIVFAAGVEPQRASVGGDLAMPVVVFFVAAAASSAASRDIRRVIALRVSSWVIALWPRAELLHARARQLIREEALKLWEERQAAKPTPPAAPPTPAPRAAEPIAPPRVTSHDLARELFRVAVRDVMPDVGGFVLRCSLRSSTGDVIVSDVTVWRGGDNRSITADEWEALRRAGAPLLARDVTHKLMVAVAAGEGVGRA